MTICQYEVEGSEYWHSLCKMLINVLFFNPKQLSMDSYALYNFTYCPAETIQGDFFISRDIKVDMSTEDKNLWLDRIFGGRNTLVTARLILGC